MRTFWRVFPRTASWVVIGVAALVAQADDWPRWLGPQGDSQWRETGIMRQFPSSGLQVKWRAAIAGGYAGPAVAGQRVFVTDYATSGDQTPNPDKRNELQGMERVLCLDAASGQLLWKHEYECPYNISYPAGPRCTPTVDGDRVYTVGAEGDLRCLDVASGRLLWSQNYKSDFQAQTPIWGFAGHPLVDGDRLICIVGGPDSLVVAFDKLTGQVLWKAISAEQTGYSTPVIVQAGGTRQLLIWHGTSLNALNPETGEVYWSEPLDPNYGMSIITPRVADSHLFVGGIVNKSMLLTLAADRPAAKVAWYGEAETGLDPVHSPPILEGDSMYGVDRQGQLCCVNLSNGQRTWSNYDLMPDKRRAHSGSAFLIKNSDRYFLFTDSGELVIAALSPTAYQEESRVKLIEPTGDVFGRLVVWSHPAFADRCVFARNDKEIICVSLAATP